VRIRAWLTGPRGDGPANIGYARCSTLAQDFTAQRHALAALGVPEDRVYLDKA
jgi:DNA invertase Pin-like site-specific DNA recombinase